MVEYYIKTKSDFLKGSRNVLCQILTRRINFEVNLTDCNIRQRLHLQTPNFSTFPKQWRLLTTECSVEPKANLHAGKQWLRNTYSRNRPRISRRLLDAVISFWFDGNNHFQNYSRLKGAPLGTI